MTAKATLTLEQLRALLDGSCAGEKPFLMDAAIMDRGMYEWYRDVGPLGDAMLWFSVRLPAGRYVVVVAEADGAVRLASQSGVKGGLIASTDAGRLIKEATAVAGRCRLHAVFAAEDWEQEEWFGGPDAKDGRRHERPGARLNTLPVMELL